MRLWTVQNEVFWERLESDGAITADLASVAASCGKWSPEWSGAYEWLARRMAEMIGRPSPEAMPLWAWQQWLGDRRARPDLRSACHLPPGERGVRIEFEADSASVVLSDFNLWHFPLNYWYIGASEEDSDAFEAELATRGLDQYTQKPLPDSVYHKRIESSWDRVFDLDWDDWVHDKRSRSEKCIQATLWRISLDAVADVKRFVAR